jgi:hypothetical protein
MANVALLYDGNNLSPRGLLFLQWLHNKIHDATDLWYALAEDGLDVSSDKLMDAEAELARLHAVKDALTNLPLRIMIIRVMNDLQFSQHDTKDEDDLKSIQALIRADIALIDECLR